MLEGGKLVCFYCNSLVTSSTHSDDGVVAETAHFYARAFLFAISNGTEGIDFGQKPARPLTNLIMSEQFATNWPAVSNTPTAIFQSGSACY